jgi:hypothetical protein
MSTDASAPKREPVDTVKLRELCERATPAPWTVRDLDREDESGLIHSDYFMHDAAGHQIYRRAFDVPEPQTLGNYESDAMEKPDAEFIAAARTALPACLDLIEDLRVLLAQAGAVVKLTAKDWGLTHPDGSTARLEGVEQLLEQIDAALRGEPKEGM